MLESFAPLTGRGFWQDQAKNGHKTYDHSLREDRRRMFAVQLASEDVQSAIGAF